MMINEPPEAFDDHEVEGGVEIGSESESVLMEIDSERGAADIESDTADITDEVIQAAEKYRQILKVRQYAGKKIRVRVLKDELDPHTMIKLEGKGDEKTVTAERIFLRGVLEVYIADYGRSPTLRDFTLFLKEAIRTSIDLDDQEQYSKICFTILAEFAGKNFAYQDEEYLNANEEDRDLITSSTRRTISDVITYLLNPEDESDTTPPSSEVPPQN